MPLPLQILECHAIKYLALTDLPRLQMADASTKGVLDHSRAWQSCTEQAFPWLDVVPGLLDADVRKEIADLFPALLRVVPADDMQRVPLDDLPALRRFAKLLRSALNAATSHLAAGGQAACVSVVRVRFPEQAAKEAFLGRELGRPAGGFLPAFHEENEFSQDGCYSLPLRLCGVPAGLMPQGTCLQEPLRFCFALQQGSPLVKIWHVLGAPPLPAAMVVDFACSHPALLLHQRGHVAAIGGTWGKAGHGLCMPSHSIEAAAKALSEGVPCIMCLRDEGLQARKAIAGIAHALHLDSLRTTSPSSSAAM